MAEAAGPSIGRTEMSPHQAGLGFEIPSRADVVSSLIDYNDLFTDIDEHPEGDVRHRFLRERSKRARYVESLVIIQFDALAALERDLMMGKVNPVDEGFLNSYDIAMKSCDEALAWISKPKLSHSLA